MLLPLDFFSYTPDLIFYFSAWQTLIFVLFVKQSSRLVIKQYVMTYVANGFISNLNELDYKYLKRKDETWYCKTCIQEILPFSNKTINPNKINLSNAGIDPNLKIFFMLIE